MALRDAVKFSGKEQALATTSGWDDILARIMSSSAATTLMSVACSINSYAFMIEPDALPKSYWSFCMQHSGLPEKFGPTVHTVMETFRAQYFFMKDLSAGIENIGIPAGVTSKDFAVKTYSILNFHKKLATQPKEVAQRYFKSIIRSSLYLTTCSWASMYIPCLLRRIFKKERAFLYLVNGFFAGMTVLIEAPSRRTELAMYCFPRGLETTWRLLLKRRLVRNIPYGDIALFSASMGVMMTLYQNEPSVINKHYLTALTRVFGHN
ncbi:hypothetical protein BGX29_001043 [Mortierella sp. GBA35]|nr:hypothetical protein BGX29_001043 [Mortierella sp. GBA35]